MARDGMVLALRSHRLVAGLAIINAIGAYGFLAKAHRATPSSDLDSRLNLTKSCRSEAAKRGRTNAALSAIEGQRKARVSLVDERKRNAATLKTERATVATKGRQIETDAAPIRYVAEFDWRPHRQ